MCGSCIQEKIPVPDEALRPWANCGMFQSLRSIALVSQLTKTMMSHKHYVCSSRTVWKRPHSIRDQEGWTRIISSGGGRQGSPGTARCLWSLPPVWGDLGRKGRMERLMSQRMVFCSSTEARLLSSYLNTNQWTPCWPWTGRSQGTRRVTWRSSPPKGYQKAKL